MRASILRAGAVAAVLLAVPAVSRADSFLSFYSGFNRTSQPNASDISVSFAVYENTPGGSFASDFGATAFSTFPAGSIDFNARYVYFYQVVNDNNGGPVGADLATLTFTLSGVGGTVSSIGFITDRVFNDPGPDGGPVGAANGNRSLGSTQLGSGNNAGQIDNVINGRPSQRDLVRPGSPSGNLANAFVALPRALNPLEPGSATIASNDLTFNFPPPGILPGGNPFRTSSVFFYTSNVAPTYGVGTAGTSGLPPGTGPAFSPSDVPVSTPEPGTMALIGLGLPLLGWGYARRLRVAQAVSPAV